MSAVTDNYNPKVSNPYMSVNITQMKSGGSQAPFFFGGSQVPYNLGMSQSKNMSGGSIKKPFEKFTVSQTKQITAIPKVLPFRK